MQEVVKKIQNFIGNEKVIVAVSTGPDSMVLLDLCEKALKKEQIIVAHVNHKVRNESETEEAYIKTYCKEHDLLLETTSLNKLEGNFEEEARKKRYEFFLDVAKNYNANYILLAHHADDEVETVLMRLLRSSSLKGYAGMEEASSYKGVTLYRPLLTIPKKDLVRYADENKIKYFIDATNLIDVHERNRIRKYITPVLLQENPNLYEAITYYSKTILGAERLVKKEVEAFWNEFGVFKEGLIEFNLDELLALDSYLSREVVYRALYKYQLSSNVLDLMMQNIYAKKSPIIYQVNEKLLFIKEYHHVVFSEEPFHQIPFSLTIQEDGEYLLPYNQKIVIEKNICYFFSQDVKICYNINGFPVVVRNREAGDELLRTRKNGENKEVCCYHQKMSDLLTNKKIPYLMRNHCYVLIDKNDKKILLGLKYSLK